MPWFDCLGNLTIFTGDIIISGFKCRNLLIYSIDLDSLSIISYEFAESKSKILANAKERLYLIECSEGSIYESDIGNKYAWQRVLKSNTIYGEPTQFDCLINKDNIYISVIWVDDDDDTVVRRHFKFDLNRKALINITYWANEMTLKRTGSKLQKIECDDKNFKLDPILVAACIHKGHDLSSFVDKIKNIEWSNKCIKSNISSPIIYRNKGNAASFFGQYLEAVEHYDKEISLDPKSRDCYFCKGDALCNIGRYLEALNCYKRAIKLNPSKIHEYYTRKGYSLYYLGRYVEAIDAFNNGIKKNNLYSFYWCPYYWKGNALYKLDQKNEALECYSKAIEIRHFSSYILKKGCVLYDLERKQEAMECYHETIELDPDDPLYICYRAHLHSSLGQEAEAILDCNKANYLINRQINMNFHWIYPGENYDFMQKTLIQCRVESIEALVKVQESVAEFKDKIQKLKDEVQKFERQKYLEIIEKIEEKEAIVKKEHWDLLKRTADCLFNYKDRSNEAILQIQKEANEYQKAIIDTVSQLRLLFYSFVINNLDS